MDLNMPVRCPKGHISTDMDYCSECGAKMTATPSGLDAAVANLAASPASTGSAGSRASAGAGFGGGSSPQSVLAAAQSGSSENCPDCGTPRATPTATFCEICRYNFVTRTPWGAPKVNKQAASVDVTPPAPVPVVPNLANPITPMIDPFANPAPLATPPSAPLSSPPPAPSGATSHDTGLTLGSDDLLPPIAYPAPAGNIPLPALTPDGAVLRWEARLQVDPSLNTDPDPDLPCPVGEPERVFPLDFADNLIGRRSERRGIFPELNVNDPCASHRHAKLTRQADGSFALLDLGSTNGTLLNGVEVTPNVLQPLKDGDQITLGCWTRIILHGLRS